jgi:hypothetical protein
MIRIAVSMVAIIASISIVTGAVAEQNEAAPPAECAPQPECRVIVSPLKPGAPGVGIRDRALIERSTGPLEQPSRDRYILAPAGKGEMVIPR